LWFTGELAGFIAFFLREQQLRTGHTIPFGPSVVLTKSAIAMAPTKEACQEMKSTE
jgi:hypothetical protein